MEEYSLTLEEVLDGDLAILIVAVLRERIDVLDYFQERFALTKEHVLTCGKIFHDGRSRSSR